MDRQSLVTEDGVVRCHPGCALLGVTLVSNPTSLSDEIISIAQAAVAVGVSIDTLRRWAARGSGPPHLRIGRAIKYRRRDLMQWLDKQAA